MTQYLGNMDSLDAIVKFDEHCIIVVLTKTNRITTDSRIFAAVFTDIFLGYVFLKKIGEWANSYPLVQSTNICNSWEAGTYTPLPSSLDARLLGTEQTCECFVIAQF